MIPVPNAATPPVVSDLLQQKPWAPSNLRRPEKRSSHWSSVRKAHLKLQPKCQACGTTDNLEVHHKKPFHLHPELELEQSNLITLCEKRGHDCHFRYGHFLNWKCWNPAVVTDVARYWLASQEAHRALERPLVGATPEGT